MKLNATETQRSSLFSIVVLAYRAEDSIIQYVAKLESLLSSNSINNYEIILVANYDQNRCDLTPDIARNLSENNSRIRALT